MDVSSKDATWMSWEDSELKYCLVLSETVVHVTTPHSGDLSLVLVETRFIWFHLCVFPMRKCSGSLDLKVFMWKLGLKNMATFLFFFLNLSSSHRKGQDISQILIRHSLDIHYRSIKQSSDIYHTFIRQSVYIRQTSTRHSSDIHQRPITHSSNINQTFVRH